MFARVHTFDFSKNVDITGHFLWAHLSICGNPPYWFLLSSKLRSKGFKSLGTKTKDKEKTEPRENDHHSPPKRTQEYVVETKRLWSHFSKAKKTKFRKSKKKAIELSTFNQSTMLHMDWPLATQTLSNMTIIVSCYMCGRNAQIGHTPSISLQLGPENHEAMPQRSLVVMWATLRNGGMCGM